MPSENLKPLMIKNEVLEEILAGITDPRQLSYKDIITGLNEAIEYINYMCFVTGAESGSDPEYSSGLYTFLYRFTSLPMATEIFTNAVKVNHALIALKKDLLYALQLYKDLEFRSRMVREVHNDQT